MSEIDNIKFSTLLFTRQSSTVFNLQAEFNFNGTELGITGAEMPAYNQYKVNFDSSGSTNLNAPITFSPDLDTPAPNPDVQNAVSVVFFDQTTEVTSSKKGYLKGTGNNCPPPGTATEANGVVGCLDDLGSQIKTFLIQPSSGKTLVTVTTENINGASTGYRIINNIEHIINTGSGPVKTWAFEVEDGNEHDTNNTFQFNFDEVAPETGLPILFYAEGTDPNGVHQSDALLWVQQ